MKDRLVAIGVMTGNSLDAADAVLTAFYLDGRIEDIASHSEPYSDSLYSKLQALRTCVNECDGDMEIVSASYSSFNSVTNEYTDHVAQAIENLISKSELTKDEIDVIGFHGQTLAHVPKSQDRKKLGYTVQLCDGNKLAELVGISVAYDFRSDDVMNGGEGAPLAPKHNEHLSSNLKLKGHFPVAFINGGNTSNISVISVDDENVQKLFGWDAGPFNHFPDMLARKYFNIPCDVNGEIGRKGAINFELLYELFDKSSIMQDGGNFLNVIPPKSSDSQLYKNIDILNDDKILPEDKLRTAEYFSAYITYHSLGYLPDNIHMPANFALFGGGWKNPIIFESFSSLIKGEHKIVLPMHDSWFARIKGRIDNPNVDWSNSYGFDGTMMEARIFADTARSLITNQPFTEFRTTGVKRPVVCGLLALSKNPTPNLKKWLEFYKPEIKTSNLRWSRASAGWHERNA